MADDTFAGPVDYLVFSFPEKAAVGEGLRAVLDRVDAGIIELLDLEVFGRDANGQARALPLTSLQDTGGPDLSEFEGANSGILDAEDLSAIVDSLAPGEFAIALVYEDRSLATAAAAWTQAGGAEVFSGGVDIADLELALEGTAQ